MIYTLGLALILYLSTSHPAVDYELGFRDTPPPHCKKVQVEQLGRKGHKAKGKRALLIDDSYTKCERNIFDYGERDTFFEHLSMHSPQRAQQVANMLKRFNHSKIEGYFLTVNADDPDVAHHVKEVFRFALASKLPKGKVVRSSTNQKLAAVSITVNRVQSLEDLFDIRLNWQGKRWRL